MWDKYPGRIIGRYEIIFYISSLVLLIDNLLIVLKTSMQVRWLHNS